MAKRHKSRRFLKYWIPLALWLISAAAWGQVKIVVLDHDLGTPLEGAQIKTSVGTVATNADGVAQVVAPPGTGRWLLTVSLPGYQSVRVAVDRTQTHVDVQLALNGVVQGAELVVRSSKPQQTDAQPGVSQVVTSQQIQTQTMGIVEDAMSAVKTLPGVGYAGAFDSRPSIDGGDPNETVATLDGAYVLSPYQWLGAYTIFNPDMIDSIKLSTGIVGVPYGQVMSGLLEVNSKTPTDTDPHADFGFSTTGLDLFYQQALGQNMGVLLGGKVTWMEVPLTLIGQGNLFATDPYIRNGTAQFYWNPTANVKWTLNGNIDTDGVASNGGNDFVFSLADAQVLVSSSLKVLLSPQVLWSSMVSYNSLDTTAGFTGPNRDNSSYTQFENADTKDYRYQARTSWDWSPFDGQILSWGIDEMWETWSKSDHSQDYPHSNIGDFTPVVINTFVSGKNTVESGVYVNDQFTLVPGTLTGEGGLRVDHSYVFGGGETLQTYPVLDPRLRLVWTFLKNAGLIQSMDLNAGSGLYSQFPADNPSLDTKYGVQSLSVGPSRAWFNVLGFDIGGTGGETLNVQAYSKTYLSRFYDTQDALGNIVLKYDGTGYAYGFNVGAKKSTAFWDVSLSYSFDVTQLYNPGGSGLVAIDDNTPLGVEYYPSYQVFHTMYFDLTWKPTDGFSMLTQGTVASGTPTTSGGRTNWQYPVDIKLDWHGFYPDSKVRWEYYFGCQDVFALLYFVKSTSAASFVSGFPIPSIGYKVSF
jgi:hypothetical protein